MLAMVIMILFIVLLLVSVPISATLSAVSLAPRCWDPIFSYIGGIYHPRHAGRN